MALELEALGTFTVHGKSERTWRFSRGPFGRRSVSEFEGAVWESDRVRAEAVWGNGTYRAGEEISEVNVRTMLETHDGALLYFDYLGRFRLQDMSAGNGYVIMTGRIETSDERYDWLNATQIVGKGAPTEGLMSYELYALG